VEKLFDLFDGYLKAKGYLAMGGQIIDATIVPAPRQRNSRDDNAKVKAGDTPEEWEKQPAKNRQKDKDARWTKKHGRSHFGYKNHVCIDRRHKLVRRYGVTSASVHDSQKLDDLLDPTNTASTVWVDSAYRSQEAEEKLAARGFKSRVHRRGSRGKPLSARQEAANKTRSSVRARVEHVFGSQHTSMGGKLVRTIGIVRATAKIGMQNLAYNMRRLVVLERGTLAAA
jgi:IS5 family transposase